MLFLATLALTVVTELGAQEIRISALSARPGHDLLGKPVGAGVSAGIQLHRLIGVRLGYETSRDGFRSFGSTCVGLVMPGGEAACAAETRLERSSLNTLVLAAPVTLLSLERLEFEVIPAFRRVSIESDQTGVVSGRRRSADKDMSGLGIGAGIQFQPLETKPVQVFLAVHSTRLSRYRDEFEVDGYSPFEHDLSITQLELGLSVRR